MTRKRISFAEVCVTVDNAGSDPGGVDGMEVLRVAVPEGEQATTMNKTRVHILGTGSSAPKRILSNHDLEKIVDTSDEWITRRSGIKERRISSKGENESTTDLAARASVNALEMAGVSPEELDMIVVGTVTPDRQFPAVACMIQQTLNANNAMAFDISAGCSGFLYALSTIDNAMQAGRCRKAPRYGAL